LKASDQVFYAGFFCFVVTLVSMAIDLFRGTVSLGNGHALAIALIVIGSVFTLLGYLGKGRGA
jgi:hypothetical protein